MIYKKAKSKFWYAAFYVKTANGDLVKRAISTKTTDRTKALEIEYDLKKASVELAEKKRVNNFLMTTAEKITDSTIQRPGLALSMVWQKYSEHHSQAKRTARTQQSKKIVWDRFNRWINLNFAGVETINDVSRDIAGQYIKTVQNKSAVTFNNEKNSLSSIWQVLAVDADLKENIWRLFKGAENDSTRYRDFSISEIKLIIANAGGFWRLAVAVAFYTGLRFKDVVHLRKSQIQGDYISLTPAKTKRKGKDVQIFIHPDLVKILEPLITSGDPDNDYLFPDAVANYDKYEFQTEFGRILEKCKIKADARGGIGFHSLRHSFVTVNEELGTDRKVIQGVVGHGSPTQTQHYSHDKKSSIALGKMPSLLQQ
jgi:integrase